MKKIAIYLRASTEEKLTEWFWLDLQENLLKSFIEANKNNECGLWKDLIYKDEWVSGASNIEERPALLKLKKDIIDWKVDIVLVLNIDRLFRNKSHLWEFMEFLKKYDVSLISKNEKID